MNPQESSVKLKAVAFDMDGLMFDTEILYWKSASAQLARRGHVYTEELCAQVTGRPPRHCFELFKSTFGYPETWQELQKESEDLFLEFLDQGFSPMPGLFELLDFLEQNKIPKGICTSSSDRVAKEVLSRHELIPRFQFILTADHIKRGKPDPEVYLSAVNLFSVTPSEMLVLEDSPAGLKAAKAAGARCMILMSKHNKNGDFSIADGQIRTLNDPTVKAMFENN